MTGLFTNTAAVSPAVLITVPMLILFLFFNKRIVAGMVAGAVKG